MSLNLLLQKVMDEYLGATKGPFKGTTIRSTVTEDIPEAMTKLCALSSVKYHLKGSIGNGQFAEVPWISIFERSITTSATKGFYVVLLFAKDMSEVYLSLNQGFTYFDNRFKGNKETTAVKEIKKTASYLRNKCKGHAVELGMEKIDLKSTGKLAQGYCAGHIAGRCYKSEKIPADEVLMRDIEEMLKLYDDLISLKGWRTLDEFFDQVVNETQGLVLEEEAYIDALNDSYLEQMRWKVKEGNEPESKLPTSKQNDGKEYYPRDPNKAAQALEKAKFRCEIEEGHLTFTRRTTGQNYTEPHHIIPISKHTDFEYSLDVEANICSLCCSCHNCLHYGIDEEREPLLKRLYEERKEALKQAGISIDYETLKNYYEIK